jgi:predicted ribosome quality control (RQC) complex YloA/Tae2 family protein
MHLSAIDFEHLVRGWQHLVGGRIQKVYLKDRVHYIDVYSKGSYPLLITDELAFITSVKLTWPRSPSGYCLFLRRRLTNARVTGVRQLGWERIIVIDVDTKEGPVELIFELLGEVNSMYVKEGKIVSCLSTHNYGGRVIRGGVEYVPPPARTDPRNIPLTEIAGEHAAKTFATEWGLGGKWAEEICAASGIEKNTPLTLELVTKAFETLERFRSKTIDAVYGENDALPFPFLTKPAITNQAVTFDAAINAVMRTKLEVEERAEKAGDAREQLTKQERILKAQTAQITKLEKQVEEKQREGELLYEHYAELDPLLKTMAEDWKKMPFEAVKKKYGAHKLVKAVHEDGTIEVEL